MLTKKQHELLLFLHRHLNEHGVSPSFDEMKEALGLKSKSGIHRLISGLEERNFIRRLPHRARAIEILRLPGELNAANGGFSPSVIEGGRPNANAPAEAAVDPVLAAGSEASEAEIASLPLYGKIAAGTPIEALRDPDSYTEVPQTLLGHGQYYALQVEGDSMMDAGILDGDTVIIEVTDQAANGEIVVALVDREEVTLKRLRQRQGAIALEPANAQYETRLFPPDRVQIQGRLAGLIRKY
ncbi:transcriptional repressor LexA [Fodinicurvata sediminis]|uniref:transcriptional repressor LexA n=1 Tax=Fodinicurvata sediminis TaxID=1121832 RepID=UPI0003B3451C|nr:transcriptional repressor LexA [Fodinicurvata sediminis]